MSNKTFDTLRFIQSIILPIAAFISALTEIFGLPWGVEVAASLGALDILFGAIVEAARKAYNARIAGESILPKDE